MFVRQLGFGVFVAIIMTSAQTAHADGAKEPEPSNGAGSPLVWGGLGVAALGLAVGGGAGILSMTTSARVDEKCGNLPCPMNVGDDIDNAATWAKVSLAGVTVGAIGLAVGIFGLLTRDAKPSTNREITTARVNVGPTSIGVTGSF